MYDLEPRYAGALAGFTRENLGFSARVAEGMDAALCGADLVVLATTAGEPYILDRSTFAPGQVVLNISLRDIGPDIILDADNVVDDVDHCLTANTSVHLAERSCGHRGFVTGTLARIIDGSVRPAGDRPVIFSPFGLGVLDLAVGMHVYRTALDEGTGVAVDDFFFETHRW
ncbi:hypothetical protein GCM10009800_36240 [Nocardiopsis rhodophaea]